MSADLEIVANAFDPVAKTTLINPSTEIAHLIARIWSRPNVDRVT
jgi:hypothetical protein